MGSSLGGPLQVFESAGRLQLEILLKEGLYPDCKVLDLGCGCLRGGYWLIHFFDPDCYFGIEPGRRALEAGTQTILEPGLMDLKRPRFDDNPAFDFSVFGRALRLCYGAFYLDTCREESDQHYAGWVSPVTRNTGGAFLTSYKKASWLRQDDYQEAKWSDRAGNCRATTSGGYRGSATREDCSQKRSMKNIPYW